MPVAIPDPNNPDNDVVAREHYDVWQDLQALSNSKKDAIWTDFTTVVGGKQKWVTMAGSNGSDALWAAGIPALALSLGAGVVRDARMAFVATVMRYSPLYLKNPAFDNTINIIPYIPPAPNYSNSYVIDGSATITWNGSAWHTGSAIYTLTSGNGGPTGMGATTWTLTDTAEGPPATYSPAAPWNGVGSVTFNLVSGSGISTHEVSSP